MEFFFKPRGVAVIGATPKPKGGLAIVMNLVLGFKGGIYPVNPNYEVIHDVTCYPSVLDVPDPVDLAIVFVPAPFIPDIVADCAKRGIKGIMIQSAGFSETGPKGKALQNKVDEIAHKTGVRIWGPNCLGLVDIVNKNVFSFASPAMWEVGLIPGNVSMVVQSGMLAGGFLIDTMSHGTMGISKVCSIGNKSDVDECDILEYLIKDPDTSAIGMYLEAIPNGRRFAEICKKSSKPIVVLKGGKSKAGAKAAASHTASMAGNGAIISGVLAQCGVVEARDFKQMLDLCRAFGLTPKLDPELPGRVAILTYSGGAGIISSDFVEQYGMQVADLSKKTKTKLATVYPDWMPATNPVDLWPAVEKNGAEKVFGTAMQAVCDDPGVDVVFLHMYVGGGVLDKGMDNLIQMAKDAGKAAVVWITGRMKDAKKAHLAIQAQGAPAYRELSRAVESISAVFSWRKNHVIASSNDDVISLPANDKLKSLLCGPEKTLNENISKKILAMAGIPVVDEKIAANADEAVRACEEFGYPAVMKGLAAGMVHKTEKGLVCLDIHSAKQAEQVFARLYGAMENKGQVLVQKQAVIDLELIVGLVRDPQFGPCVMCGLGGIYAEVFDDAVFAMAPLNMDEALALLKRLKNQKLLDGFRGATPVDREALARVLVLLCALGMEIDKISEVDINPIVITNGKPLAVDATIITS